MPYQSLIDQTRNALAIHAQETAATLPFIVEQRRTQRAALLNLLMRALASADLPPSHRQQLEAVKDELGLSI